LVAEALADHEAHPPVAPLDLHLALDADDGRVSERALAGPGHLDRHRLRLAEHRQISLDLPRVVARRTDIRTLERDRLELRRIEEVCTLEMLISIRVARVDLLHRNLEVERAAVAAQLKIAVDLRDVPPELRRPRVLDVEYHARVHRISLIA